MKAWEASIAARLAPFWFLATMASAAFLVLAKASLETTRIIVLATVAGCLIIGALASREARGTMVPALYLFVLIIFHFGLLLASVVDPTVLSTFGSVYRWYFREGDVLASYWASLLFVVGFTVAICVSSVSKAASSIVQPPVQSATIERRSRIGFYALTFFAVSWVLIVVFIIGATNYIDYKEGFRGGLNPIIGQALVVFYPCFSALFFFTVIWSSNARPSIIVFALWSAVAFPIGLRGEVLFPAVMTLSAMHAQGRMDLRWTRIIAGSYIVLTLSFFVRLFRNQSSFAEAFSGTSGMYGLAELGNSLRPVAEVAGWLRGGIDQLRWGETYYAPIERTITQYLIFSQTMPAALDDRLMNILLRDRTGGNYGFSVVAEALINFGYLGCFCVGLGIGAIIIRYGRSAAAGRISIVGSAFLYAMYFHIRQSFVGAYGSFFLFAATGLALAFLSGKYVRTTNVRMARKS